MRTEALHALDDEEFADEMKDSLGDDLRWHSFMDGTIVDRTHGALEVLHAKLTSQILVRGEDEDVDRGWLSRARGLRAMVLARVRQVDRVGASNTTILRRWKAFAHELCEIVEDSDLADELLVTDAPFGDITAQQWVSRRREKRAVAA